jgi:hypothetical protein
MAMAVVVYRAAARELSLVRGSQVEGSGRGQGKIKKYTGRECPDSQSSRRVVAH